jgi:carbonic anhydrase
MDDACAGALDDRSRMTDLNRRELLVKGAGAAAAAVGAYALGGPASTLLPGTARAATATPTTTTWNHDPGSPIGPLHWGEIDPGFRDCAQGMRQSPVNFETARVGVLHGPPLSLSYDASELVIENTGHVVEVPIPAGVEDVLHIGGDRYSLTQYHFHTPSEHTVNGRHADVEGHFVHTNAAGDIAVVGVFYRIGPRPNRLLETILRNAPETSGEEAELHSEANPADLFKGVDGLRTKRGRVHVDSFYAYAGSLTTPGCTENVRWSVLSDGGHVSGAAVAHFHDVIAQFDGYDGYRNNNRPVQPLNGRVVELRRGANCHH